jgi:hypothetical protein
MTGRCGQASQERRRNEGSTQEGKAAGCALFAGFWNSTQHHKLTTRHSLLSLCSDCGCMPFCGGAILEPFGGCCSCAAAAVVAVCVGGGRSSRAQCEARSTQPHTERRRGCSCGEGGRGGGLAPSRFVAPRRTVGAVRNLRVCSDLPSPPLRTAGPERARCQACGWTAAYIVHSSAVWSADIACVRAPLSSCGPCGHFRAR